MFSEKGTLLFEADFLTLEMKEFGLPVEVRTRQLAVVAQTSAPNLLTVPAPGRYYVLARLPAGQEMVYEVEVQPGETKVVRLTPESQDLSPPGADEVSHYLGLPERTLLP